MPKVTLGSNEIHYMEKGTGPAAVLIHGFPLDSTLWLDQLEGLADMRRVVAIDLRGSGGSGPVTGTAITMEQHASDVDHLCDHLGADQADIVGLSMGGYVALAFAELFGHRVRSLGLLNTKATSDTDEGRAGRDALAQRFVTEGRHVVSRTMADGLLGPDASLAARSRALTMMEATPYETIVASLEGMKLRPDRTHVLATVAGPSLVLTGENDGISSVEECTAMAEELVDAELVVVPAAGHFTPIEAPDATTAALRSLFVRATG